MFGAMGEKFVLNRMTLRYESNDILDEEAVGKDEYFAPITIEVHIDDAGSLTLTNLVAIFRQFTQAMGYNSDHLYFKEKTKT